MSKIENQLSPEDVRKLQVYRSVSQLPDMPRRFIMKRHRDVSGVSGTGTVAWGVQFPDGRVAFRWNTKTAMTTAADSIEDVLDVHGHGTATEIIFLDD